MGLHGRASRTLFIVAGLAAACGTGSRAAGPAGAGNGDDDAPDGGQTIGLASLTISTGILRPSFDPNVTDYDVTALNSVYPVSVTATAAAAGTTLTVHGVAARSGEPSTFTLQPREDIAVVVETPGLAPRTYTVHYVPSDFPTYEVTSSPGAGTEDVLMNPNGEYVLIVDRSGAPLYYRTFLPYDLENFQQSTLPDGTVVYSLTVGVIDPSGWTLGVDHLMDAHFNDIGDYQLPAYAQHGVLPAEGHEMMVLGDQHYVALSYVQRTLDLSALNPAWSPTARVMSDVMQEVDHGSVLVEWDSANVSALYADSVYDNAFEASSLSDYLHLNSIDLDPADENFVVSFRHASSIAKLDRHTGQILWTLGGKEDEFGLTADQVFSMQHHVRMHPDGTMTVFDNGNADDDGSAAHQTRILSFTLDEANHRVSSFQVLYTKPSDQPPTGFMGSATPLAGGRLFAGWGGWYTNQLEPAATEIVGGVPVWTLEFKQAVTSYRALPIPAL
jgi:arylsulfate sulfotransferase